MGGYCEGEVVDVYLVRGKRVAEEIPTVTFSELEMKEADIEEILRNSIDMLCDDEESMVVIGQQVKNESLARSDLTAVDSSGSLVLIEIKRDRRDIQNRRESFEFQAIRYAASYAAFDTVDEVVKKIFAPYIERYRSEFELGELTSYELGMRKLNEFLKANNAEDEFNKGQRIILVASDYDDQTLSAVAWLNGNGVNISCFGLTPYRIDEKVYIHVDKVLPLAEYSDFYVHVLDRTARKRQSRGTRRSLPKIDSMLEWGVVKPGDIIVSRNGESEGELLENGNVHANGREMSMQMWLKKVYGWSSVQTYMFAVHKDTGKTLSEIRREYMDCLASKKE